MNNDKEYNSNKSNVLHHDKEKEFQYILHQLKFIVDSLLSATQKIQNLLETEKFIEKCHLELEARFGILKHSNENNSGLFISSVKKEFFQHVLETLSSFQEWTSITEWKEYQDFFYTLPDQKKIRTTVSYTKNNSNDIYTIRKYHVIKNVLSKKTLSLNHDLNSNLCVRITGAIEYQVSENILPDYIHPELVRIKKRKSFFYTPPEMNEPTWQFDLTLSWMGKSKMECEIKQRTENPNYEIECECLSIKHYQLHKTRIHQNKINQSNLCFSQIIPNNSEYVIQSLLMKMFDFVIALNPNEYSMNQLFQTVKLN